MTELEQFIFNEAKNEISRLKNRIKEIESENKINNRYLEFPFMCDGVFDTIVYDREIKDFTKIRYWYGIGDCTIIEGLSEMSGFFKKSEMRELSIEGKF